MHGVRHRCLGLLELRRCELSLDHVDRAVRPPVSQFVFHSPFVCLNCRFHSPLCVSTCFPSPFVSRLPGPTHSPSGPLRHIQHRAHAKAHGEHRPEPALPYPRCALDTGSLDCRPYLSEGGVASPVCREAHVCPCVCCVPPCRAGNELTDNLDAETTAHDYAALAALVDSVWATYPDTKPMCVHDSTNPISYNRSARSPSHLSPPLFPLESI